MADRSLGPGVDGPVIVLVRAADANPVVDPVAGTVTTRYEFAELPPDDEAALELGLRIAAGRGVEPIAISIGGPFSAKGLTIARTLGLWTIRVPWPPTPDDAAAPNLVEDESAMAAALADAIRRIPRPSLIMCGERGWDGDRSAIPALLAAELGAVQACGLVHVEPADDGLRGVRRLEGGRRELLAIPLPAVCTIEAGGVRLRRAALPVLIASADELPVVERPRVSASRIRVGRPRPYRPQPPHIESPTGSAHDRLAQLTGISVTREAPIAVGPLDPPAAADALLEFLARTGYLDAPSQCGDPASAAPARRG